MENVKLDMGNFLIVYYCHVVAAINDKRDFDISDMKDLEFNFDINNNYNLDETDFLKYLPRHIPFSTDLYEKLKNMSMMNSLRCDSSFFRLDNNEKMKMFTAMQPFMQTILDEALLKTDLDRSILVDHPVIHYRCSDTPFTGNHDYKFQKYAYFKDALDKIATTSNKTYDTITLLSFTKHRSDPDRQDACNTYAKELKQYLESELGYKVNITSHSNIEDFAILFYAPAVISTGGSYPFMSGFFGKGVYIQPASQKSDGIDFEVDPYYPESKAHILHGYSINHTGVDYFDIVNVSQMLHS